MIYVGSKQYNQIIEYRKAKSICWFPLEGPSSDIICFDVLQYQIQPGSAALLLYKGIPLHFYGPQSLFKTQQQICIQ